jgi:hypothetical protein
MSGHTPRRQVLSVATERIVAFIFDEPAVRTQKPLGCGRSKADQPRRNSGDAALLTRLCIIV